MLIRSLRALAPFLAALALFGGALVVAHPGAEGDEPHYALEAISLARDGDRDLSNDYADAGRVREVSSGATLEPEALRYGHSKRLIPVHNPGLALLLAPVAALGGGVNAMRFELVVLAALGGWLLMGLLEALPFGTGRERWLAWLLALGSLPVLMYASQLYPEMPAAVLVLAGARLLVVRDPRWWTWLLGGLAVAALPWLNGRFALVALALLAALSWRAWRLRGWRSGALCVAPLVASLALLAVLYDGWYGSPSPSAPYAMAHATSTLSGLYRVSLGGILGSGFGWLPFAPVGIAALAGIGVLGARAPRPWLWGALTVVALLLLVGADGGGLPSFSFPARYQVMVLPLAAVPLLALLQLGTPWRAGLAVLALLSAGLSLQAVRRPFDLLPGGAHLGLAHATAFAWPDVSVAEPQFGEVAPDRPGRPAPGGPPPPAGRALRPAGGRGLVLAQTTSPVPPGGYDVGVFLRAQQPTPDGATLARIRVREPSGALLVDEPVSGLALRPQTSWRLFLVSFHPPRSERLHAAVSLSGAGDVTAAHLSVRRNEGSTLTGVPRRFPDLGLSALWALVLSALGGLAWRASARRTQASPAPSGPR